MKKTLLVFFLSLTICAMFGCESPNANAYQIASAPAPKPAAARTEKTAVVKTESQKPVAAKPAVEKPAVAKKAEVSTAAHSTANEKAETKPVDVKVANAIERNPYLSSILKPLLPPRTTMANAAAGFKNDKQFIAALHASRNLGIPFNEIKTRMTGERRMSLNDAIRDIRPEMTKNLAKAEAHKGEEQAKDDQDQAKDTAKKAAAQEKLAANKK